MKLDFNLILWIVSQKVNEISHSTGILSAALTLNSSLVSFACSEIVFLLLEHFQVHGLKKSPAKNLFSYSAFLKLQFLVITSHLRRRQPFDNKLVFSKEKDLHQKLEFSGWNMIILQNALTISDNAFQKKEKIGLP